MTDTYRFEPDGREPSAAVRGFLRELLAAGAVEAVLALRHRPVKGLAMPALVTRPDRLDRVDPLAPCFPLNAARIAARLARKPMGGRWAAVLRPCEARAWVELVKLKQARTGEALLVSFDCPGAFQTRDYPRWAGDDPQAATAEFLRRVLAGEALDPAPAPACLACEFPLPPWSDLHIGFLGAEGGLWLEARSPGGREALAKLKLAESEAPPGRSQALAALSQVRRAYRDRMFARTLEAVGSLDKAAAYFADCINCYNCRVACPVCYCKECVFATEVFNHEPFQYRQWAGPAGVLKLPTDTLLYHLTRLAHMSTACVGCGQCSNACPNGIAVMEVFRTVGADTQRAFACEAGRDPEEAPPLAVFKEAEFAEVVGLEGRN